MSKINLLICLLILSIELTHQTPPPAFIISPHFQQSRIEKLEKLAGLQSDGRFNQKSTQQINADYTDPNFLKQVEFSGEYHSLSNNKLFDYLQNKEGLLQSIIFQNTEWESEPNQQFNAFGLQLYDPIYHDRDFVLLIINLNNRTSNGQWKGVNANAQIISYWKDRQRSQEKDAKVNFTMTVSNIKSQQLDDVQISLYVKGNNFQFKTNLKYNNQGASLIAYCVYTTVIVTCQIVFLWRLIIKIDVDAPHIANKISLTTVSLCNIMDFYLTIIHVQYVIASVSSYYFFYIFPAISYIVLFIVYDMKLLFLVWRSHTLRQIENPQDLRKNLTVFYIKFYLSLFIYLTLVYFFLFDQWFIICQNLLMLPQIIRNVRVGNNPGFQPTYVMGYLGMRFFIPFYQRLCPVNHFLLMPMVGVVVALGIIYIIQITILFLQKHKGARFFIPRIFQPDFFNYHAKIKYDQITKQLECSICLMNFFEYGNDIQGNQSSLTQPIVKQYSVMRTPCNHYFHKQCLVGWADVKLQCPTCRAHLPPL